MRTIHNKVMPLEIPLRKVGNSLMLTIPSDIAKLYGLKEGTMFEVIPDKEEMFILKVSKKVTEVKTKIT